MTDATTILVLEDNDFVRMQIVKFLQDGGYKTIDSPTVMEGFDLYLKDKDLVKCAIVDVRMEPDSGFDFIKKVHAEELVLPVILATGDQNHDILSKASQMGVSSVLMKPVNKDRLLKMVERTLQTARA